MIKLKNLIQEQEVSNLKGKLLYHVTLLSLVDKIKQQGIVPQKTPQFRGAIGQDIRKNKKAIYAFDTYADAVRWAFKIQWDKKVPAVIVVFESDELPWVEDTHWEAQMAVGKWLLRQSPVKRESIKKIIPYTPEMGKLVSSKSHDELKNMVP